MPISEQIKADWCAWDASNTCVSVWFTIVRGPIRLEPCSDGHIWQYRYSWINQDRMLHKADVENIWQQNWLLQSSLILQSSLSVQRAVSSAAVCSSQTVIYQPHCWQTGPVDVANSIWALANLGSWWKVLYFLMLFYVLLNWISYIISRTGSNEAAIDPISRFFFVSRKRSFVCLLRDLQ